MVFQQNGSVRNLEAIKFTTTIQNVLQNQVPRNNLKTSLALDSTCNHFPNAKQQQNNIFKIT